MIGHQPLTTPLGRVLRSLREWPVAAQHQARRNAMLAATACTARRIEREAVADFLSEHARPTTERTSRETSSAAGAARSGG